MEITKKINKKRGFTLVEVLVVGILLSILAFGAFSLFSMYSNSAREQHARLRMQRWGDGLTDDIARQIRSANLILPDGPTWGFSDYGEEFGPGSVDFDDTEIHTASGIVLFDSNGNTLGGFRFNNTDGHVEELVNNIWIPYTAGGDVISLRTGGPSTFVVRPFFNEISLNATFSVANRASDEQPFELNIERGIFRCRVPL